jgi:adenylosuccinate synthase
MPAIVILGAQWGDEGKGKVVDMLATDADLVCRCQVSKSRARVTVICMYIMSRVRRPNRQT